MKKKFEGLNCLYPMPTVLVGIVVNGKPNFTTNPLPNAGISEGD